MKRFSDILAPYLDFTRDVMAAGLNQFRPCPQSLTFVHLPKCAGTSLKRTLGRCYQTVLIRRVADIQYSHIIRAALGGKRQRFDPAERDQILEAAEIIGHYHMNLGTPLVMGHLPFNRERYREVLNERTFITVMREPVERWISNYRNSIRPDAAHPWSDHSLDEFLETEYAEHYGCSMVRHLVGIERCRRESDLEKLSRLAQSNLDCFELVGFVDTLPALTETLARRLKLPMGGIPFYNRSKNPLQELRPDQRRRIEELCAPDLELYHCALNLEQAVRA